MRKLVRKAHIDIKERFNDDKVYGMDNIQYRRVLYLDNRCDWQRGTRLRVASFWFSSAMIILLCLRAVELAAASYGGAVLRCA